MANPNSNGTDLNPTQPTLSTIEELVATYDARVRPVADEYLEGCWQLAASTIMQHDSRRADEISGSQADCDICGEVDRLYQNLCDRYSIVEPTEALSEYSKGFIRLPVRMSCHASDTQDEYCNMTTDQQDAVILLVESKFSRAQ